MFILIIYLKSHQSRTGNIEVPNADVVHLLKSRSIRTLQFGKLIVKTTIIQD